MSITLIVIYRPPMSSGKNNTMADFLDEFYDLLHATMSLQGYLLIVGDFNIWCDNDTLPDTMKFNTILSICGLKQHVTSPSHVKGHTLDLVISRESESILSDCNVYKMITYLTILQL